MLYELFVITMVISNVGPHILSGPCRARAHAIVGCLDGNWRVSGKWPETRRGFGPCFDVHARLETGNNALPNVETGAFGLVLTP